MSQSYIQYDSGKDQQQEQDNSQESSHQSINQQKYQQIKQLRKQAYNYPIGANYQHSSKELFETNSNNNNISYQEAYQQYKPTSNKTIKNQKQESYEQQSNLPDPNLQKEKHLREKFHNQDELIAQNQELTSREQNVLIHKVLSNFRLMKDQLIEAIKLSKLTIIMNQIRKCKNKISENHIQRRKLRIQQRVGSLKHISSNSSSLSHSSKLTKIKSYRSRDVSPMQVQLIKKIQDQKKLNYKLSLIALQIDNKLKIKKKQFKKTFYRDDNSQGINSLIEDDYQINAHKVLLFQNQNQRKYHELLIRKHQLLQKTIDEQKQHFTIKKQLLQQQTDILKKQLQYVLMETQKKQLMIRQHKKKYQDSLKNYRLRKFHEQDKKSRKKKLTPSQPKRQRPLVRPSWKIQGININKKSKDKHNGKKIGYSPRHEQKVQFQYFNKAIKYNKEQFDRTSQKSRKSSKAKSLSSLEESNRFLY